jgi:hypothetical protein
MIAQHLLESRLDINFKTRRSQQRIKNLIVPALKSRKSFRDKVRCLTIRNYSGDGENVMVDVAEAMKKLPLRKFVYVLLIAIAIER